MIRVEKTHLPVAALTHPGMKGKNNEDRFGVTAFRLKTQPPVPILLAILSDGIGGHRAGEVASELTVNTISQYVEASDGQNPSHILEQAIINASQAIFHQSQQNREQAGMGATCACAWIAGDRLYTASVGDSRIYLMRNGSILQISTDHTWIQEALEIGIIQPDQVNGHPNSHVIRRYLGSPTPPEVDFRIRIPGVDADTNQGLYLLPSDRLLLCSDGLTDLVSDDEILNAFNQASLEDAGQQLIDLANERGGHDNITLVAIQIPEIPAAIPVAAPPAAFPAFSSRSVVTSCLGIIAIAVLVGMVAGGWLLYSDRNNQPTSTPNPALKASLTTSPLPDISPTPSPTPRPTSTQKPPTPTRTKTSTRTSTSTPVLRPLVLPTRTPVRLISPTLPGLPVVTNVPQP
jgi:PPM family protein phosphatase